MAQRHHDTAFAGGRPARLPGPDGGPGSARAAAAGRDNPGRSAVSRSAAAAGPARGQSAAGPAAHDVPARSAAAPDIPPSGPVGDAVPPPPTGTEGGPSAPPGRVMPPPSVDNGSGDPQAKAAVLGRRPGSVAEAAPGALPVAGLSAGEVLGAYLGQQATAFLRALAVAGGDGGDVRDGDGPEPAQRMRRAADRIAAALDTYADLTDPAWAQPLRAELGWLSATLIREHQYAARLARLMSALHRLSAETDSPLGGTAAARGDGAGTGQPTVGAARAGALLDRQLTLARTRAHSAALQATGSARFHAVADAVAVLVSELPLSRAAAAPARAALPRCSDRAHARLVEAAAALPLSRSVHAYNAEALLSSLSAEAAPDLHDAPWNRVRVLLRVSRYALEVFPHGGPYAHRAGGGEQEQLAAAGRLLARHQEAAEAAAAAASAARTPRIAPATAYALGVLHADQRAEVEAARFAFARLWH